MKVTRSGFCVGWNPTAPKGEALLEVETDKVNVEFESSQGGELKEIMAREADFVKFGSIVALIENES